MYMPPFEEVKKANEDELLKIIRGTKKKMGRLRNIMEHPDYKYRTDKKCPSDLVIYKCDRDFLNMAIIRYISLGGDYKYGQTELNDTKFNDKLEEISKITFINGGFFEGQRKTVVDLSGNEVKLATGYLGDLAPFDIGYDKENFLYEFGELHIGEWRRSYQTERFGISILDGEQWSLEIEYRDGKKKEYGGSNAYPYNYEDLISLLGLNLIEVPFLGEIET